MIKENSWNIGQGLGSGVNGALAFFTSSGGSINTPPVLSEKLRVTSTGLVGIGTTTPAYTLSVGNNTISGIVARFTNSTGTCDINPTTTSLSCSSDINLKKNIVAISDNKSFILNTAPDTTNSDTLTKLITLSPVQYNWNSEQDTDPKHTGFIAQEVEQVFPDLVFTDATTHLKSLNYIGLIPYTIQSIKDMNLTLASVPKFSDPSFAQRVSLFLKSIGEKGIAIIDRVVTNNLCINKSDGTPVCVNGDQLSAIVNQINQNNNSGVPTPTPTPDPVPVPPVVAPTPVVPNPDPAPTPDPVPTPTPALDPAPAQ